MRYILASGSPRRKELLSMILDDFEIVVSNAKEDVVVSEPNTVTKELAYIKAKSVWDNQKDKSKLMVIGADTVVSVDGKILGKPANKKEAFEMINMLQGKTHQVYTGVAIFFENEEHVFSCKTDVNVDQMTNEQIEKYISTDEPYDKAGAYGIQGLFAKHIKSISGCYYNVVGLPVNALNAYITSIVNSKPCR